MKIDEISRAHLGEIADQLEQDAERDRHLRRLLTDGGHPESHPAAIEAPARSPRFFAAQDRAGSSRPRRPLVSSLCRPQASPPRHRIATGADFPKDLFVDFGPTLSCSVHVPRNATTVHPLAAQPPPHRIGVPHSPLFAAASVLCQCPQPPTIRRRVADGDASAWHRCAPRAPTALDAHGRSRPRPPRTFGKSPQLLHSRKTLRPRNPEPRRGSQVQISDFCSQESNSRHGHETSRRRPSPPPFRERPVPNWALPPSGG